MWLPEEESEKEVTPESQTDETSQVDDIYVPGIGLRSVLYDDDTPQRSPLWPRVRATYSRGAEVIRKSASRTASVLHHAGTRTGEELSQLSSDLRSAAARKASASRKIANELGSGFHKAQQSVVENASRTVSRIKTETQSAVAARSATVSKQVTSNLSSGFHKTRQLVVEGTRSTAVRLRAATQKCVAATPRIKAGIAQALQTSRTHLARFAKSASAQTSRVRTYRPRLPKLPTAVVRNAHRAQFLSQSFSKSALTELGKLPAVAARYQRRFNYRPDIATLRRAAPALVILGAMVLFTLQQIVVAVRR